MALNITEKTFKSSKDETEIFYRVWQPEEKVVRVMVLQHGFGEHSGRYQKFIEDLNLSKTAFYALDSRGHGNSEGIRGHVNQFQLYIDDLSDLISIARKENNIKKILLFGHSMGGVIVLQYTTELTNQELLTGLITSAAFVSPLLDFEKRIKKFFAIMLSPFLPALILDAGLDLSLISKDKDQVQAYKDDPLVHGKISIQMGKNLFELADALYAKAHLIKIPLLMMHGTADGIADIKGSEKIYNNANSDNKTFYQYDGYYHEIINELPDERMQVIKDVQNWIGKLKT